MMNSQEAPTSRWSDSDSDYRRGVLALLDKYSPGSTTIQRSRGKAWPLVFLGAAILIIAIGATLGEQATRSDPADRPPLESTRANWLTADPGGVLGTRTRSQAGEDGQEVATVMITVTPTQPASTSQQPLSTAASFSTSTWQPITTDSKTHITLQITTTLEFTTTVSHPTVTKNGPPATGSTVALPHITIAANGPPATGSPTGPNLGSANKPNTETQMAGSSPMQNKFASRMHDLLTKGFIAAPVPATITGSKAAQPAPAVNTTSGVHMRGTDGPF